MIDGPDSEEAEPANYSLSSKSKIVKNKTGQARQQG